MSKITFRADDDLVERLETLDTSKSEAMRDALRIYLNGSERDIDRPSTPVEDPEDVVIDAQIEGTGGSVDEFIRDRVDELVADRLDELLASRLPAARPASDLNVNVRLDGVRSAESVSEEVTASAESARDGDEPVPDSTKRKTRSEDLTQESRSKPCEKCGETVSGDHVYCPNCGEKASHRVFCECGDELRSDWAFCPGCGRRTSAADVLERT